MAFPPLPKDSQPSCALLYPATILTILVLICVGRLVSTVTLSSKSSIEYVSDTITLSTSNWLASSLELIQFNEVFLDNKSSLTSDTPKVMGVLGETVVFEIGYVTFKITETFDISWGDMDGDGDLDLVVGNWQEANQVYRNEGEGSFTLVWVAPTSNLTTSISWGDMDGDGDLDIVTGNYSRRNQVYRNEGEGVFVLAWDAPQAGSTHSVAWGDADGDGDLDLAVGNTGTDQVYRNDGDNTFSLAWSGSTDSDTQSIAWGDVDGDRDLDLALGNGDSPNQVYRNNGDYSFTLAWSVPNHRFTNSIALGDMDGDGDLDLVIGDNDGSKVYTNDGRGNFTHVWGSGTQSYATTSIALGDADSDGDLDLAISNWQRPNQLYRNEGANTFTLIWSAPSEASSRKVVWGDMDGDSDLDIAVGNIGVNQVYRNEGDRVFTKTSSMVLSPYVGSIDLGDMDGDGDHDMAVGIETGLSVVYRNEGEGVFVLAWDAPQAGSTHSVAWGDADGDGDLDLAVGNTGTDQVYRNDGDNTFSLAWSGSADSDTQSIAWGDVDGDGDLDLALGNGDSPNQVYRNDGDYSFTLAWSAPFIGPTSSIALGDMDGDGDLDLAVGFANWPNQVYQNMGDGTLTLTWTAPTPIYTTGIAWGDINGDGDLDLAVGNANRPNQVYENDGNENFVPVWSSPTANYTTEVTWGDMDGDGDIDLAIGSLERNQVYQNTGGVFALVWSDSRVSNTSSIAWGDVNQDGDLDMVIHSGQFLQIWEASHQGLTTLPDTSPYLTIRRPDTQANLLATPTISITYTLFDPQKDIVGELEVFYSVNNGGQWFPAVPTPDTPTTHLLTGIYPTATLTNTHVYQWDTLASGFFGRADQVLLRFVAHSQTSAGVPSSYLYINGVAGSFQRAIGTATTPGFRVQGTQFRVIGSQGPLEGALIYRQANSQSIYEAYRDHFGRYLVTDPRGYLQGRGVIALGDRLVALHPNTMTQTYTLYHTSAPPTETGLEPYTVVTPGVQTITVSADNNLLLFDLSVSLEWDARNDPLFLNQLYHDLQRTSQLLYDATNGQVALGKIQVYQAREQWMESDLKIHATNSLRPSADIGGIVTQPVSETLYTGSIIANAYLPGSVHMGATWNRFGNSSGNLGEDWPRTLAHELAHYLFFEMDNYLGFSSNNQVVLVDCAGSLMTDPYREDYSEFLRAEDWTGDCQRTLANHTTGRSDWETLINFYPMLEGSDLNSGPSSLPLGVTQIVFMEPAVTTPTHNSPILYLTNEVGQALPLSGSQARAYLFQTQGTADLADDTILSLGAPNAGILLGRGATLSDRLCVFARDPSRVGCLDPVNKHSSSIALWERPQWHPQIVVTPITSRTLTLTVTQQITGGVLYAQLIPVEPFTDSAPILPLNLVGEDVFTQTFTMPRPTHDGYVHVWHEGGAALHEELIEFTLSQGWGPRTKHGWGWAPIASSDGQVSIFAPDNLLGDSPAYTLQAVPPLPLLPLWLTVVGEEYRFSTPDPLVGTHTILFRYMERDVPRIYDEAALAIYYLPEAGGSWQRLETVVDVPRNMASALMLGEGVYAMMATIEVAQFSEGWNLFGYPLVESQPIASALRSIETAYTSMYHYRTLPSPRWFLYDQSVSHERPEFEALVNDLSELTFGQGYWLYATEPITLYLDVTPRLPHRQAYGDTSPPATFYGWVIPTGTFTPMAGMPVTAQVGGQLCGQGTVVAWQGQLAYKIQVACEEYAAPITFKVGGQPMDVTPLWDNRQAWFLPLASGQGRTLYLPWVTR